MKATISFTSDKLLVALAVRPQLNCSIHQSRPTKHATRVSKAGSGCGAGTMKLSAVLALLVLQAAVLHRCTALKLTVHPAATECFTQFIDEEHFQARSHQAHMPDRRALSRGAAPDRDARCRAAGQLRLLPPRQMKHASVGVCIYDACAHSDMRIQWGSPPCSRFTALPHSARSLQALHAAHAAREAHTACAAWHQAARMRCMLHTPKCAACCARRHVPPCHCHQVHGGPRVEGALFVSSRQSHHLSTITALVRGSSCRAAAHPAASSELLTQQPMPCFWRSLPVPCC